MNKYFSILIIFYLFLKITAVVIKTADGIFGYALRSSYFAYRLIQTGMYSDGIRYKIVGPNTFKTYLYNPVVEIIATEY